MPYETTVSPQWQEKATDFFSSSGVKLKEAGNFFGEVAKDAKGNVAEVAGRVGSLVKSRWSLIQQTKLKPGSKDAVQERFISAAASTSTLLRKGISETKDKVAVGKLKVEEVAKKTAQRSKSILTNIERWQKGVASTDVFGVPIEINVQRQQSIRPIPHILVSCADYLILSGLNTEYLFKSEGDKKVIQQLISLYNEDWRASLPEGVNPVDIAILVKCYIASLPEPLITFDLYHEVRNARSSIPAMRNILKRLPSVNYMTLEYLTALLLRVSQKSPLNKMDASRLSMEMAPLIIWQKEQRPEFFSQYCNLSYKGPSKKTVDLTPTNSAWAILSEEEGDTIDASSAIPLDDGSITDLSSIEVIQCLIQQHNDIFTDANVTVWR
ncbi:Rho GTPase-activating protein domain [Macleaya cordata]|uniref:Rho GTPase-activating protein domain n=1 Tax=Macleaya cordata TaxID=56857 RepID=A0A200Q2I6_MACCD|nr:Rho GTPase-activating protein domain [Macleaya cordata]